MNFSKKFYIIFIGVFVLSGALFFFGKKFMDKTISKFSSGKMESMGSMFGMSNTPVFETGTFSEDGTYFAYTYQPKIIMPDVNANVTIRGMGFPTYFQVMETATGKRMLKDPYKTGKTDQLYVVWTKDEVVWLIKTVINKGSQLALYDMKANKFRFEFGELEKLNPSLDWKNTYSFYINNTNQKGLILEANDKRNYRIDPNTGKAEIVQGKLERLNYISADNFQVSVLNSDKDYRKKEINGSRQSITINDGKTISQDDFIDINYLTLTKNRKEAFYKDAPITYYKENFFVLSPIASDNKVDMELSMLDKNTLKTVWKLQLPQKKLKTMIQRYGMERFFLKGNQLLATNNNYLMTIDLSNGKIVKQIDLYQ